MIALSFNDIIAVAIAILTILALFVSWLVSRSKVRSEMRAIEAVSAVEAFQHEAAEKGKRLLFGLVDGLTPQAASVNALAGLGIWRETSARAVFNDQPAQAITGEGSLALLSQMVLRGVYQDAVAVELFKTEQAQLGGLSAAAGAAGLLPEVNQPSNAAVILIGNHSPIASLAANLAGRKNLPLAAISDTLTAQSAFLISAPLSTQGEDYYAAQTAFKLQSKAGLQLRALDILRALTVLALLIGAVLKLTGVIP